MAAPHLALSTSPARYLLEKLPSHRRWGFSLHRLQSVSRHPRFLPAMQHEAAKGAQGIPGQCMGCEGLPPDQVWGRTGPRAQLRVKRLAEVGSCTHKFADCWLMRDSCKPPRTRTENCHIARPMVAYPYKRSTYHSVSQCGCRVD